MVNTSNSVRRHLKIFQLFGFLPLSVGSPNLSKISKPFLALSVLLSVTNSVFHIRFSTFQSRFQNSTSIYLHYFTKFALIFIPPSFTIAMVLKRFVLERAVSELTQTGEMLKNENRSIGLSIKVTAFIMGIVMFADIINCVVYCYTTGSYYVFFEIAYWVAFYIYFYSFTFQFAYLVQTAGRCFSALAKPLDVESEYSRPVNVKCHVETYDVLYNACSKINEVYNVTLAGTFVGNFALLMDVLNVMLVDRNPHPLEHLARVMWCVLLGMVMFHLLFVCQSAISEAEECNKALLSYIIHDKSDTLKHDPLVMIHLSSRKTLTFTACKCINVDYSLGLSMVAAFLTYIVVLYQIESPNGPSPTIQTISNCSVTN